MTAQFDTNRTTSTVGGYQSITVDRVTANTGAVISGVQLSGDLDPNTVAEIKRALADHKVIFFRDQQHVDDVIQHDFASLLGIPTLPHPTVTGDGKSILPIDSAEGKANSWHTDVTFIDRIPSASLLRAVSLPPYGGTTTWANTAQAYAALNPALQSFVDQLWAVHSNLYDYAAERSDKVIGGIDVKEEAYREAFGHIEFETEHPVVRVHPVTGERNLLLGHFLRQIVGFSTRDSQDIFNLLQRHTIRLEHTVQWSWRDGDLAVWDNQATQHYAIANYDNLPRRLHRITLAGEIPVSVDGRQSRSLKGDASHFSPVAA